MYRNGLDAYRKTGVTTADPKRLVLICYDGAIGSLKIAKEKYLSGAYEDKAKVLQRAQDFIGELDRALDFEKGGAVARNLHELYNFMTKYIMESDLKRDLNAFDKVIGMLEDLRSAWEEIFYGKTEPPCQSEPLPDLSQGRYQRAGTAVG